MGFGGHGNGDDNEGQELDMLLLQQMAVGESSNAFPDNGGKPAADGSAFFPDGAGVLHEKKGNTECGDGEVFVLAGGACGESGADSFRKHRTYRGG